MAKNSPVCCTKYHPLAVASLAVAVPRVAVAASIFTPDAWASVVVTAFGSGFFGTLFLIYGPNLNVTASQASEVLPLISEQ